MCASENSQKSVKKTFFSLHYMSPVMLLIGKQRRLSNVCNCLFTNEAGSRLSYIRAFYAVQKAHFTITLNSLGSQNEHYNKVTVYCNEIPSFCLLFF